MRKQVGVLSVILLFTFFTLINCGAQVVLPAWLDKPKNSSDKPMLKTDVPAQSQTQTNGTKAEIKNANETTKQAQVNDAVAITKQQQVQLLKFLGDHYGQKQKYLLVKQVLTRKQGKGVLFFFYIETLFDIHAFQYLIVVYKEPQTDYKIIGEKFVNPLQNINWSYFRVLDDKQKKLKDTAQEQFKKKYGTGIADLTLLSIQVGEPYIYLTYAQKNATKIKFLNIIDNVKNSLEFIRYQNVVENAKIDDKDLASGFSVVNNFKQNPDAAQLLRYYRTALGWKALFIKLNRLLVKKQNSTTTYKFDFDIFYNRNANLKYQSTVVQDLTDKAFKFKDQGFQNLSQFKQDQLIVLQNNFEKTVVQGLQRQLILNFKQKMVNYSQVLEVKGFQQYFSLVFKTKSDKKEQMVVIYDLIRDQVKVVSTKQIEK